MPRQSPLLRPSRSEGYIPLLAFKTTTQPALVSNDYTPVATSPRAAHCAAGRVRPPAHACALCVDPPSTPSPPRRRVRRPVAAARVPLSIPTL
eukprot:435469-Prymnesium_polylepis.1